MHNYTALFIDGRWQMPSGQGIAEGLKVVTVS